MTMSELLQSVTAVMAVCTRHVSRAAKKLHKHSSSSASKLAAATTPVRLKVIARGASLISFLGAKTRKTIGGFEKKKKRHRGDQEEEEEYDEIEGVWRRTILMGEKCQPLDFSGVIYYDGNGKQLSEIPTPRSPLRSPLPSFSFHPVVAANERDFSS
ncbi:hypothetical protein J5N97_004070 [Dioscorea zingiberensis]|uniref:Uncharacterized protein n=1 Tax=Dioscorea zingiberensis TaxID=325984 RepID=A0A9D5HR03_9LILI|nr:hypothetical protein J5N97_004070 [Dioscorea zingiberensis]